METIERLETEGRIGSSEAAELREVSSGGLEEVKYILKNLGVHVSFGAIFAYDLIPLPMGTISRVLWVAGNRIRFTFFQRDSRRLAVHSMKCFWSQPSLGLATLLMSFRCGRWMGRSPICVRTTSATV